MMEYYYYYCYYYITKNIIIIINANLTVIFIDVINDFYPCYYDHHYRHHRGSRCC